MFNVRDRMTVQKSLRSACKQFGIDADEAPRNAEGHSFEIGLDGLVMIFVAGMFKVPVFAYVENFAQQRKTAV